MSLFESTFCYPGPLPSTMTTATTTGGSSSTSGSSGVDSSSSDALAQSLSLSPDPPGGPANTSPQTCLPSTGTGSGYPFSRTSTLDTATSVSVKTTTSQSTLFSSFAPKAGLTFGGTAITITADGIDTSRRYACLFTQQPKPQPHPPSSASSPGAGAALAPVVVPALVTDWGVAVCVSPPSPPGNVSVSLAMYPEQGLGQGLGQGSGLGSGLSFTWCCGYFLYYPPFKALALAPALVPSAGGTLLTITTSTGT